MKTITVSILFGAFAMAAPVFGAPCSTKTDKDIVATAVEAGSFKTLAAALGAADLVGALKGDGPFTVFAPTDAAFAKLPKGTVEDLLKPSNKKKLQEILKFHVIAGKLDLSKALAARSAATLQGGPVSVGFNDGKVKVNNANLLKADLKTSNGIIHVIDTVLLPPEPSNDIASVARKAGQFNTLLAAVKAAGLEDALTGDKPLTVFAPTDAAFKALPKGTVETLLKPENKGKLKEILTLHVVSGKVSAGDALNASAAKALSGGKLGFGIDNGSFKVNGVNIVKTDIACDNGVIHVIDAVLLPSPKKDASAAVSPSRRIEVAIENGVEVFNRGDHGQCAKIYRECVAALSQDEQVRGEVRRVMKAASDRANKIHCQTSQAWMLRSVLDHAYASMIK